MLSVAAVRALCYNTTTKLVYVSGSCQLPPFSSLSILSLHSHVKSSRLIWSLVLIVNMIWLRFFSEKVGSRLRKIEIETCSENKCLVDMGFTLVIFVTFISILLMLSGHYAQRTLCSADIMRFVMTWQSLTVTVIFLESDTIPGRWLKTHPILSYLVLSCRGLHGHYTTISH